MEKKNKLLFILAVLLGTIPFYPIIGWIYIFNSNLKASHIEKQAIFDETILFGQNFLSNIQFHLIIILLGLTSILCLSVLLNRIKIMVNKKLSTLYYVLTLILLVVFSIVTFLNIWSIL